MSAFVADDLNDYSIMLKWKTGDIGIPKFRSSAVLARSHKQPRRYIVLEELQYGEYTCMLHTSMKKTQRGPEGDKRTTKSKMA